MHKMIGFAARLVAVAMLGATAATAQSTANFLTPYGTIAPGVTILCPSDASHATPCSFGGGGGGGGLGGLATTAAPTYTNGQTVTNFSFDLNGGLRVSGGGGGSANANGRAAAASSAPVVLSTEDLAAVNGLFKSGQSIGNTSFGISGIADGVDIALGAKADAAWTTGSGSVTALLKAIDRDTLLPLAAGSALIGKVGFDQTTPGTTNKVSLAGDTVVTSSASPAVGAASLAVAQVTVSGVSGTPTLIAAARTGATGTGRASASVENESTTVVRICATSACTAGIMLPGVVGASITLSTTSAIYGFVPSGSAAVSVSEIY